ncbi:MAG: hypothetical protein ACSW76_06100 [Bacteroidaceae bacterium]
MKKKKTTTIVIAVLVICALGIVASRCFNWPVDRTGTKGDIAKSARFSRKAVDVVNPSNMQELLVTDESFKHNMVTAFVVMQSRVKQFNTLVDMSVDVAGKDPSFDKILADMKAAKPMLENVSSSMKAANSDLNAVLGGEDRKDVAQNTSNAALAYATLQKQNKLAERFIEATDEYLKKSTGNEDRLKLVRDQWLEYQLVTSALNKDEKAQKKLVDKGYLLSSKDAASTLKEIGGDDMSVLTEVTIVDGLVIGEQPETGGGVCIRYEDLGGIFQEIGGVGVFQEVGGNTLLEESGNDGLLEEVGNGRVGLLEEAGNNGLLEELGGGTLFQELGGGTLFQELGGGTLFQEITGGGPYLGEAFGEALITFGFGENGGGLFQEVGSGTLLEEVDLGTVFQEIGNGNMFQEVNTGGFGQ